MSSSGGVPYLGSKISLISKSEIRYEGILYTIDTKESTVALAKVRSYGTEDRPTERPVAPRDETYEYIIFRGADIKDIRVCQPPKPQPTLEGGLPNDPAIVQHSAGPPGAASFASGGAQGSHKTAQASAPGGQTGSATSYGPIGSTTAFGQASGGPFGSSGGPSTSAAAGKLPSGSPVMELLRENQSGGSTPAAPSGGGTRSPVPHEGRSSRGNDRGRGGVVGFYRGGRGRGGGGDGLSRGGGHDGLSRGGGQGQGYRGRGGPTGEYRGRGGSGFQPGRPTATKKEPLKFDDEYDFDKANEEFKEVLEKLQKTTLETPKDGKNGEAVEADEMSTTEDVDEGEIEPVMTSESPVADICYDKAKSFFDSISCEAVEKSKGRSNRPDWKAEKKLNRETFGVAGNIGRRGYNRRGGSGYGGYNRGGGYNNYGGSGGGRGGYGGGYNNYGNNYGGGGGFNNGYNGRFARDGSNFRGGRGGRGNSWGGRGQRGGGRGSNSAVWREEN